MLVHRAVAFGFLWPTLGLTVGAGLQIRITFKNQELLRGVTWEVKRGERVGLVGENTSRCIELCQPRSSSHAALAHSLLHDQKSAMSLSLHVHDHMCLIAVRPAPYDCLPWLCIRLSFLLL